MSGFYIGNTTEPLVRLADCTMFVTPIPQYAGTDVTVVIAVFLVVDIVVYWKLLLDYVTLDCYHCWIVCCRSLSRVSSEKLHEMNICISDSC